MELYQLSYSCSPQSGQTPDMCIYTIEFGDVKSERRGYRGFYFSLPRMARIGRDVPKNLRLLASAIAVLRMSFQKEAVN